MKQWLLPADGTTIDDLRLVDADVPAPGPGQVRVRVAAISLNRRDAMILAGPFGRIPGVDIVPLSDVAGAVDAVGAGVEGWAVGHRVMTAHVPAWVDGRPPLFAQGAGANDDPGVAAEHIVVDATALVSTPPQLSDAEASTLQVAGVTAWNSVFGDRPTVSGDRVAVLGSGGVAIAAAQLARAAGASVYVVSRRAEPHPGWAAMDVAGHVNSATPGWGTRLGELSGGVHKIVDTVGPGTVPEALEATTTGAEIAVPGLIDLSAPTVDLLGAIARQVSIRGVAAGSVRMHRDLAAFMTTHDIRPVIHHRVPFDRLPDAYTALDDPQLFGKVVVEVA